MQNRLLATIATFGAGALAVTGCGSDEGTAESVEQQHIEQLQDAQIAQQLQDEREAYEAARSDDADPSPTASASPRSWAQQQLDEFIATAGANSLQAWPAGSAERNIIDATSPDSGIVRFEIADGDYDDRALDRIAMDFMSRVGCAADDVDAVTVEITGGTETATRTHCG